MDPYRLPRHVIPQRYDLRLEPNLESATFAGEAIIAVSVHEATAEIVLNAAELRVAEATIANDIGTSHAASVTMEEATERCRLTFPLPIAPALRLLSQ